MLASASTSGNNPDSCEQKPSFLGWMLQSRIRVPECFSIQDRNTGALGGPPPGVVVPPHPGGRPCPSRCQDDPQNSGSVCIQAF